MRHTLVLLTSLTIVSACSNSSNSSDITDTEAQTTNIVVTDVLASSESSPMRSGYTLNDEDFFHASNCGNVTPEGALPFVTNTFSAIDEDTFNSLTNYTIYDSTGQSHTLQIYYVKICANQWQANVLIEGRNVGDPLVGDEPLPVVSTLNFSDSGTLETDGTLLISNWLPLNSDGEEIGALGPLPVVNGGGVPINMPPTSSNFTIDFSEITLR